MSNTMTATQTSFLEDQAEEAIRQKNTQDTVNIYEKAIAFTLCQHRIGDFKKVDSNRIIVDNPNEQQPDKKAVSVSKKLFESKEYKQILALDSLTKRTLKTLAIPVPFQDSIFLIPFALVQRVTDLIKRYEEEREKLVERFLTAYSICIEEAKDRLGVLFNAMDYKTAAKVRKSFWIATSFLDLNVPGKLSEISPEIFVKEQEAFKDKLEAAAAEIQARMREAFAGLVSHMVTILTPSADGKQKIFRDSSVNKLREFMQTFSARNIAEDSELEDLVKKAKDLLGGKSAQALRDNDLISAEVKAGLETIKKSLNSMVMNAKSRKFDFSDEE